MTLQLEFLTTRELATRLKRAPETLVRWRRMRIGPPYRLVQGRVLYELAEVAEWMASERRVQGAPSLLADAGAAR